MDIAALVIALLAAAFTGLQWREARESRQIAKKANELAEDVRQSTARSIQPNMQITIGEIVFSQRIDVAVQVAEPHVAKNVSISVEVLGQEQFEPETYGVMIPGVDVICPDPGVLHRETVASTKDGMVEVIVTVRYSDRDKVITWERRAIRRAFYDEEARSFGEQDFYVEHASEV